MTGSAPGKAILFGEHAVVYGRPAIAVPVHALQAEARLSAADDLEPGQLWIEAPDIGFSGAVELDGDDERGGARAPADAGAGLADHEGERSGAAVHDGGGAGQADVAGLKLAVRLALEHFDAAPGAAVGNRLSGLRLELRSEIPVAAGLGSSAAVTIALLRAVAEHLEEPLADEVAAELAYQVEQHYHGTPSGIDNSVVAHGKPVFFVKGEPATPLRVGAPLTLVLADSGRAPSTREMVSGVRRRWEEQREEMEAQFDRIGALVEAARKGIEAGRTAELGPLMDDNQQLLERIRVSTPELEVLIESARAAGAMGAKLSGAGGGGLVVALADPETAAVIQAALRRAGAPRAFITEVKT